MNHYPPTSKVAKWVGSLFDVCHSRSFQDADSVCRRGVVGVVGVAVGHAVGAGAVVAVDKM